MDRFDILPTIQSSIAELLETVDIPQRVLLCIFGFLAVINAASLRLCLDAALKEISRASNNSTATKLEQRNICSCQARWNEITRKYRYDIDRTCSSTTQKWSKLQEFQTKRAKTLASRANIRTRAPEKESAKAGNFIGSTPIQTAITSAFYAGYIFSQVPGGLLTQKYGGKLILAWSLMGAGILTLLTPLAIRQGGPFALIVLRFLIGLFEGPALPALSALLARWVPPNERGKLCSLAFGGNQIGIVFVNFGSTVVLHLSQWPAIFYFFGVCALIWSLCFILFCSNEPKSDPFITSNECQYLQRSISSIEPSAELSPIPWKEILINAPIWAMISSAIQYNWSEGKNLASISPVLAAIEDQSLSADLRESLKASTPYLLNWILTIVAGIACDTFVEYDILSMTDLRKIMAAISALGARFFSDFSSCLTCNQHENIIAKVNCLLGTVGTFYAGAKLTPLDLGPNYAGVLMAISNCVGSVSGRILPKLEALLPNSSPYRHWRSTLCLTSATPPPGDVEKFASVATMGRGGNQNRRIL